MEDVKSEALVRESPQKLNVEDVNMTGWCENEALVSCGGCASGGVRSMKKMHVPESPMIVLRLKVSGSISLVFGKPS